MKNNPHNHSYFIYEVDNIPDHRSRRFGCCPYLLAVITTAFLQTKSRIRAATQIRQVQNEPLLNKLVLPFYHIMPAHAKQAEKGSSQNRPLLFRKEN